MNELEFGLGYRHDIEDHASILATSTPFVLLAMPSTFRAPESISHRGWRKAKSQGQVGSCSGFSRASAEEVLNYIATGGEIIRLSAMHAYLHNQMECGLLGSDAGATIDASLKAAGKAGICTDEAFPYPGRYLTQIPAAADVQGKLHLIKMHSVMRSYEDCLNWILSGTGQILDGTAWLTGMTTKSLHLEVSDLTGRMLGGHAKFLSGFGLPDPKWMAAHSRTEKDYDFGGTKPAHDADGKPYLDEENSHDEGYGDFGFKLISPRAIQAQIDNGATYIGISDLQSFGYRKVKSATEMFA